VAGQLLSRTHSCRSRRPRIHSPVTDRPAPSLVVGRDRAKVLVAAARLGLR